MKRSRLTMKASELFRPGYRIFVNRIEERFETALHEHDFIELNYVAEGTGYQYLGGTAHPAGRGDFYALPVGASHVFRPYSADKSRRLVVYNVVFQPELLEEIAAASPELRLLERWRDIEAGPPGAGHIRDARLKLEPLFERLHEEHASPRAGTPAMLSALLTLLLIEWLRLREADASGGSGQEPSPIHAFAETIEQVREQALGPITLHEAAERSGMSERHFQRLFRRHAGQTFHRFVQRQRIAAASELLRATEHKLDTIAGMVGYRDIASFSRVFKQIEGETPGRYRAKALGNASKPSPEREGPARPQSRSRASAAP
ncbi:AraC family transcriptional regulator [Paenibacillus sp. B01]|uniref:AraC family transcriptional regulator n=1 Tax=Paenibacillus sp. B01 TaxID=2660554 RepID=UPI0018917DE6|nr:AraC family transcriptional regulator [Paenibacillus sp. B01]